MVAPATPPTTVGGKINNESELVAILARPVAYRLLFAAEIGAIDNLVAGELLDLDPNEFAWLRAVAVQRLGSSPPARQPRRPLTS